MPDRETRYETKQVRALRGTEGRVRGKWEADGWEVANQTASRLHTVFTLRRPKSALPLRYRVVGAALAAVVVTAILVGTVSERGASSTSGAPVGAPAGETETPAAPSPTPVAETATPSAQTSSIAPTSDPDETTSGLGFGWASTACNDMGEAYFPFGFDGHTILGRLNAEVQGDVYFLKYEADITNEFDAERAVVVECTVGGTDESPVVVAFSAN